MPYKVVKLNLTKKQQKQALKGGAIRLSKEQIGTGPDVYLHELNAQKLNKAKNGVNLKLSPGEIVMTAEKNEMLPVMTELSGAGFFDSVWEGIKKVGSFIKDSGIGTILADAAVPVVSGVIGAPGAAVARNMVKNLTGVGLVKTKKTRTKVVKGSGLYI